MPVNSARDARAIARICRFAAAEWILAGALISAALVAFLPLAAGIAGTVVAVAVAAAPFARFRRIALPPSSTVHLRDGENVELSTAIRQVTAALQVDEPIGVEISPDCDAWLEPRADGPVLVIGAPFLWWLRVGELRGLLAPVLAGIEAAHDPAVRRARGLSRRLELAAREGCSPWPRPMLARTAEACRARAERMERAVAAVAAERARPVEPTSRVYAHEQAGLVAVGWDRLLTRLAIPAWRRGLAPQPLNAALAAALTELGRRDRIAVGPAGRLTERPACDLLDEPGAVDLAVSALAPRVYLDRDAERPLPWSEYIAAVAEPQLRAEADAAPDHPLIAKVCALLGRPAPTGAHGGAVEVAAGLRAVVQCGLVDLGHASWAVDWLDGVVLHDRAGLAVPVDELVHGLLDTSDPGALREWIGYAAGLRV
jgi:hypothetical protein